MRVAFRSFKFTSAGEVVVSVTDVSHTAHNVGKKTAPQGFHAFGGASPRECAASALLDAFVALARAECMPVPPWSWLDAFVAATADFPASASRVQRSGSAACRWSTGLSRR